MLAYNMRLAVKSFKRNPGLTLLMVCAIALGISRVSPGLRLKLLTARRML